MSGERGIARRCEARRVEFALIKPRSTSRAPRRVGGGTVGRRDATRDARTHRRVEMFPSAGPVREDARGRARARGRRGRVRPRAEAVDAAAVTVTATEDLPIRDVGRRER